MYTHANDAEMTSIAEEYATSHPEYVCDDNVDKISFLEWVKNTRSPEEHAMCLDVADWSLEDITAFLEKAVSLWLDDTHQDRQGFQSMNSTQGDLHTERFRRWLLENVPSVYDTICVVDMMNQATYGCSFSAALCELF